MKTISFSLIIFLYSSYAHAYIDPGLIAGFFNMIVASLSAFFLLFVFRPFNFIKNLFSKKNKGKENFKKENNDGK